MPVRKETYLILGIKLNEEATRNFWEKDFRDEMEWDKNKSKDKPYFITDGMNGLYSFFGFIQELKNGNDFYEDEIKEISYNFDDTIIISEFKMLFPEIKAEFKVKMYYLPHYV